MGSSLTSPVTLEPEGLSEKGTFTGGIRYTKITSTVSVEDIVVHTR